MLKLSMRGADICYNNGMNQPYIYFNDKNQTDKDRALVVLPEIFGMQPFITQTVDRLAKQFGVLGLGFDHLYVGTNKVQLYDYQTGGEAGIAAMQKVSGEKFLSLFSQTFDELQKQYPAIKHVIVLGFCFGGRLAFLTGRDKRVNKIISFYGGGPHTPFYAGMGSVEALTQVRHDDSSLQVLAFYGSQDQSISETDRNKTKQLFSTAHISYQEHVYDAPHAFANYDRQNYNEAAANQAWAEVTRFLA